jgi:hypothetical protein
MLQKDSKIPVQSGFGQRSLKRMLKPKGFIVSRIVTQTESVKAVEAEAAFTPNSRLYRTSD